MAATTNDAAPPQGLIGLHQLPNLICIGRVVAVFIALAIMGQVHAQDGTWSPVAIVIITVAALSDRLDGFLAKRYGWSTRLGALLDQISDKLVTLALFSFIAVMGFFPVWGVGLIVFRELFVTALRITANLERIAIKTSQAGRFKTFTQQVAVLLIFCHGAYEPVWQGFTASQLVLWGGWLIFWAVMLGLGKRGFAGLRRVYTFSRPDPETGAEGTAVADLVLVYLTILAMGIPLTYGGPTVVLIITVGTGWTYLTGYLWGRRVLAHESGQPAASLRNMILSTLGSGLLAAGLTVALHERRDLGTMWALVAALSVVWIALSTASYLTGQRAAVTPTSA